MRFATKAIHAGQEPNKLTGAVTIPISMSSTYTNNELGYDYSRISNPTRGALETSLAALENAKHALAFSAGLAANDAVTNLLSAGDHLIISNEVYGGTYSLIDGVTRNHGIEISFVDATKLMNIEVAIKNNTKMVFIETPTNPTLKVIDIEGVVRIAQENNLISVVDNTFATPYLQNPLEFGIDVVTHSMTKYLGGHSDVVGGAVLTSNDEYHRKLYFVQKTAGAVPSPFDCFLVLRGIKTLPLRMEKHCKNAKKIAEHFKAHDKIKKVIYPGLEDHPQHELAKKQMRNFGGMVTMEMNSPEQAKKLISNVKLFTFATSLGGVESLIEHPVTRTHKDVPEEERLKLGLTDSTIRLSVGIEDVEDLIEDLEQALK
jgi:cystathionine gamma-lyase